MESYMTSKTKATREVKTGKKTKQANTDTAAKQDPRIKIEDILAQREFDKMFEL
ncbi:hypothetical protein VSAL_I1531 [Aliivibrio salmonicida LFI1238]|uniref:Uncharacterized protein n=1 Tax=Aliivibrio salmonicida (strain LFI1238) TaxID=316275 RepID=B6ELB3_ALISL|nr:hypothetical protein VSAL_I1531 [Aliivibrio salmonicida LFI1238]